MRRAAVMVGVLLSIWLFDASAGWTQGGKIGGPGNPGEPTQPPPNQSPFASYGTPKLPTPQPPPEMQPVRNEFDGKFYPAYPDRLIVRFLSTVDALQIAELHKQAGVTVLKVIPELRAQLLKLPEGVTVDQARAYYKNSGTVRYAEPDFFCYITFKPDDLFYEKQWSHQVANSEPAWDISQEVLGRPGGDPNVVIAILDTGVDVRHEDLKRNIWTNPGEMGLDAEGKDKRFNNVDDDNNGFKDDWQGWDFDENDNEPDDFLGHGTHVAGIAAAVINNKKGVAGVAGNCRIMAVKVLSDAGGGTWFAVAQGIIYAAGMRADVMNMSLGGRGRILVVEDAIDKSFHDGFDLYGNPRPGVVIVAAAGNDAVQLGGFFFFSPVCLDGDENWVIGVAATSPKDTKTSFTNFGSPDNDFVDCAAPGGQEKPSDPLADMIFSCIPQDDYWYEQGTSMAAPFVAGLAGLCKSVNSSLTNVQIRDIIKATSIELENFEPNDMQDPLWWSFIPSWRLGRSYVSMLGKPEDRDYMLITGDPGGLPAPISGKIEFFFEPNVSARLDSDMGAGRVNVAKAVQFARDGIVPPPAPPPPGRKGIGIEFRVIKLGFLDRKPGVLVPQLQPDGTYKLIFNAPQDFYVVRIRSFDKTRPWPKPRYRVTVRRI